MLVLGRQHFTTQTLSLHWDNTRQCSCVKWLNIYRTTLLDMMDMMDMMDMVKKRYQTRGWVGIDA